MMSDAPAGIDTSKASIARVYDAFLGGKDNYEVDREVVRAILEISPDSPAVAREFRDALVRMVRFLVASAGIDQFLDCGSGLPTAENTHQVAQRINSEATVVYFDNDPIVAAHGRALLEDNDRTHFGVADLRQPEEVLRHPAVTRHLDFARPLALMQCGTMHHLEDSERPDQIMARYIEALPSGSYVAISHFYDPADGSPISELAREAERRFQASSMGTGRYRTMTEIAAYLDGLELVEPGLVPNFVWWPDGPWISPIPDLARCTLVGLARKP
jgi:hypothetical protein